MTEQEVRLLLKILPKKRVLIDLFGGSGVLSKAAVDKYKEVIYNDWKADKFLDRTVEGIEVFKERYEEILGFADKNTVIFADPPFFNMSDFNKWATKDHLRLIERLAEVDACVFMLNSVDSEILSRNKVVRLMKWGFRQEDPELKDRVCLYIFKKYETQNRF